MNRQEAFAYHGVPRVGRSQWHAQADDGVHVLSVWEDNVDANSAEAHIHNHSKDAFAKGTRVRVVIQRGDKDPRTQNMITTSAEPDLRHWTIEGQETRSIDHPHRKLLHVLHIKRAEDEDSTR